MTETAKPDLRNPVHFLAFGFGAGLSPRAPGTCGTLAALPVWWLLATFLPLWGYLLATLAVIAIGPWLCGQTARDLEVHDHGGIVWDEIAGLLVTLVALPVTGMTALLGFVAFRVFDILKPWPISWLDKHVGGGVGIMVDDLLAGVFAAVCLQLLNHFLPMLLTLF
jgi:phosphatidylglycerophosphatase A